LLLAQGNHHRRAFNLPAARTRHATTTAPIASTLAIDLDVADPESTNPKRTLSHAASTLANLVFRIS
jgi:hypothetical protein